MFASGLALIRVASTASVPNINVGMQSGSTSKERRTPLPRNPNVNAVPIDPIRFKTGIPSNSDAANTNRDWCDKPNCTKQWRDQNERNSRNHPLREHLPQHD